MSTVGLFISLAVVLLELSNAVDSKLPLVIIHAGPWKTGTTYIQHNLYHHMQQNSDGKVIFPHTDNYAHHYLADHIRSSADEEYHIRLAYLRTLPVIKTIRALKNDTTAILSSESFCLLNAVDLRLVRALFPKSRFRIRIVLFHRNFCSWTSSIYQQDLKDHYKHLSYSSFALQQNGHNVSQGALYVNIFTKFVLVFTLANVRIVDYDNVMSRNVNVIDALFGAAGIPPITMNKTAALNAALSSDEIVMRQLWRIFDFYAMSAHKCTTLRFKINQELHRNTRLATSTLLGEYLNDIPRAQVDVSLVKLTADEVDKSIRSQFAGIIVYGNRTASELTIGSCRNVAEIDVDDIMVTYRHIWTERFEKQFNALSDINVACVKI